MLFVILTFALSIFQAVSAEAIYEVYVKQSGSDTNTGTSIGQEMKSLKSAYDLLGYNQACKIYVVNDAAAFKVQAITFSRGLTIEGVNSDGKGNTMVSVECDENVSGNLFFCSGIMEFKYLAFHLPITSYKENDSRNTIDQFIFGNNSMLTIKFCKFIRPSTKAGTADYCLVRMNFENLFMDSVECVDDSNTVTFNGIIIVENLNTVTLTNVSLKKISSDNSIVSIHGFHTTLNGSSFTDCKTGGNEVFFVSSIYNESTFTVGNGCVTSFTSCSCSDGKSGGIFLRMLNIASASQLKWPKDGTNLVFQDCFCGEGESKRNTGLYIEMRNDTLFKDIADAMTDSFAADYTRICNKWNVVGYEYSNEEEFDFVSTFFDPLPPRPDNMTRVFVKNGGKGNGMDVESAMGRITEAYDYLEKSVKCFIDIVETDISMEVEAIILNVTNGISIEGINSQGTGNTIVSIDCHVHSDQYLFSCLRKVEFMFLAFHFPIALSDGYYYDSALIYGCDSLTIKNCKFIRPSTNDEKVNYHLVLSEHGDFYMDNVECVDDSRSVSFNDKVFYIRYSNTVSFTNVTLKKISSGKPIVQIYGDNVVDVTLNNCTFTECQTESEGSFYVSSYNSESTFTVGDGGVTSFTSCSCTNGESGGIYLNLSNARSASQLRWPTNGKNLVFQNCSANKNGIKRNTGLNIGIWNGVYLFKDIADAMKTSFAAAYTRRDNSWFIVGYDYSNYTEYDFASTYFDPPPPKPDYMIRAFVKNGGKGNGINVNSAINSIFDAYDFLEKSGKCFIDIIKTAESVKAERIIFSTNYGITIEGVNENGKGNIEVSIDCDVSVSSILFSCQRIVEFKFLAFQFSSTEKNWDSLISAGYDSTSLKISTCRFVRIGSQSQEGMNSNADGDNPLASSLVSVTSGSVEMDTVKCTDETSFVSFSSSPFSFSGASEVSLSTVEISKVNVRNGAAIGINDGSNSSSKVSIEGLNMNEVKSEKGAAAGLDITLSSKESRVAIGRSSKCSFKSCSAPEGKSGAIFIEMPKATSNLKLPSEHNLEIDSSNTAGSKTTSLFIIAPDFDKFCKQEDAFAFANDYDDSTVGWVEGAKDAESEAEDVYEKYVKVRQEKLKEQNKKRKAGIIAAIVVPIVVVVAAVVVIVIVVVVVRKRKSRIEESDDKEQEMKD
ncbi:uncharacterized protein MONOS_4916 [Monocercomonoides exilis]|uniref:uncharacterized protein n=1 Tax=Monocercomonoides exilis TaxID=2049356 RepID=UPI00355A70C3|nr:hypothetical protein MONOS_4916 [Monocercomonoides exilis]|eukprot:MONOS_4916.1-p1 / transcript=MONOS_4916.1 / gene=MONOS_4916 / organism=Monocercomonoides_exilis_PA203 / gene_product=unspecified product / transcript_product=unspecified product / location=Mono_scaffold00137:84661-88170(+) / protein_length=1170 / sequence_SO=supercontig / SO=protein_coding / is_pseudo=false